MVNAVTSFKEVNNLGFNAEKTEKLVENLKQEGIIVGIEDLSAYIRKQGLIVQEHIGRKRSQINLSTPKVFGVDLSTKGDETNEFFRNHLKLGKISFLPEEYETKLTNIENSVRVQRKRLAIGYDMKFMLLDTYHDFLETFEKRKEEYFKTRDEIINSWDILIERFKVTLKKTLKELGAIDAENVYNRIISSLPSKEAYKNSFYMTLSAKAFPVTENLSMFSESIQESIREGLNQETIQTLYDIIGSTLNDAFENVCRVIKAIKKEDSGMANKVPPRTLDSVKNTAKKLAKKNIFHNDKIESIRLAILEMLNLSVNPEVMCEEAEAIASMIYGYAKELEIDHCIDLKISPLSEDELLSLFEMVEENELIAKSVVSNMRA